MKVSLKKGEFEYSIERCHKGKCTILSGGMDISPTWEEYVDDYNEPFQQRLELIKKYLIDNNLIGETGEWINDYYFEFDDDFDLGFTWRAWGDFMQALVGKREGYMKYYM